MTKILARLNLCQKEVLQCFLPLFAKVEIASVTNTAPRESTRRTQNLATTTTKFPLFVWLNLLRQMLKVLFRFYMIVRKALRQESTAIRPA
jgi:hypothetical protein